MRAVEVATDDPAAQLLWTQFVVLANLLPGEWVLIGGLMVQLHALERGRRNIRVTRDIDILGQARPRNTLPAIDRTLHGERFRSIGPDPDGYGFRYVRGRLIVDVLAPDGLRSSPQLGQGQKAVGVPGGTQALHRSEPVAVTAGHVTAVVRRPTVLGSLLIKARSLMKHSDPESQREDVLRLLSMVDDPRAAADELTRAERRWLIQAAARIDFERPSTLDADSVRKAELAYKRLTATPPLGDLG